MKACVHLREFHFEDVLPHLTSGVLRRRANTQAIVFNNDYGAFINQRKKAYSNTARLAALNVPVFDQCPPIHRITMFFELDTECGPHGLKDV
jgi:hypothetical protein